MKLKKGDKVSTDFDGTLAEYDTFVGPLVLGEPIPEMVDRVKQWIKNGVSVVVFTARIDVEDPMLRGQIVLAIQGWCKKNIGIVLEVTDRKKGDWAQSWDDKTVRVITNTGKVYPGSDDQA